MLTAPSYLPNKRQLLISAGFFVAFQLLGEVVYPKFLNKSVTYNAMQPQWQRYVGRFLCV